MGKQQEKERQRKLTKAEQRRKEQFGETKAGMEGKGYNA